MSEIANSDCATDVEKPVQAISDVTFPPFSEPTDADFEDDISEAERLHYKTKFQDLKSIEKMRLHCTACDRHLGCSTRNESRMRMHPLLRTLVCHTCHTFYNSGEFDKGDDGSELYCRWCGQGGQVYCCSDCPHVFCAKCIKRNLGAPKIKEIENTDDWKCFKCNSRCLWDIRAICWALLRYCDVKNKLTYHAQDPILKEAYEKDCAIDHSECCKPKPNRRSQKIESVKKEGKKKIETVKKEETDGKTTANIISKLSSTIQVKKFASINPEETNSVKPEKKPQKRPASPKLTPKSYIVKNPIAIAPCPTIIPPITIPPLTKKMRLPTPNTVTPKVPKPNTTYARIRPRPPTILNHNFNGYNNVSGMFNNSINDNINLSLESLTQGLDMSAVAAMTTNAPQNDDVVCTPDFPLEPLCEVMEENDDDVQCITPAPVATPRISTPPVPPPLVPRTVTTDLSTDNIIQMTENDVTVNAATGGLKFRVDPQTLSSNKMYRLPDGRIFAINVNPNMPGGYSATIVAVAEAAGKQVPKGATYAAKLSAVATSTPTPKPIRTVGGRTLNSNTYLLKRSATKPSRAKKASESRECDLHVPVEWYRYNLIDAVDALEYALVRLQKLKKEATTMYLRTRSVNEMRNLHRTLERLLNTSAYRFNEIRDNLNKELKGYVTKKMASNNSEDDDDVEILPDLEEPNDPIFIDENSVDSNANGSENQEVDLTGAGSSEHYDSTENKTDNQSKNYEECLLTSMDASENVDNDNSGACEVTDGDQSPVTNHDSPLNNINEETTVKSDTNDNPKNDDQYSNKGEETHIPNKDDQLDNKKEDDLLKNKDEDDSIKSKEDSIVKNDSVEKGNSSLKCKSVEDINGDIAEVKNISSDNNEGDMDVENKSLDDKADSQGDSEEKNQDTEMSEEMIENLLKDTVDDNPANSNSLDVPKELHDT